MVINYNKTKELVFRRPNPRRYLCPDPIPYIEQLNEAKLLGVVINNTLAFDSHVKYILQ